MKVRELKELLEGFDEDLEVRTYEAYVDMYFETEAVTLVTEGDYSYVGIK